MQLTFNPQIIESIYNMCVTGIHTETLAGATEFMLRISLCAVWVEWRIYCFMCDVLRDWNANSFHV